MNASRMALLAALFALPACNDPAPSASEEVAGELRALRLLLAQQARAAAAPATGPDDVQAALAPLREGLEGLVAAQRELAAKQTAMTQELQRWSQLLVESVGAARADEAKAMAARLQQLERSLQEQDTRHREVEGLLQGALERTADRLEDFLRRLQGQGEAPKATEGPAKEPPGETAPAAPSGPTPANPGRGERPADETGAVDGRGTFASARWLWFLVTAAGTAVALLFVRRARRQPAPIRRPEPAPASPATDQGAQEIWAAAALLGEAVGRLRQKAAGGAEGHAAAAPVAAPGEPPTSPGAAAPVLPALASETVRCPTPGSEGRVLAALAAEPCVLRRPGPTVLVRPGGAEIRFHLLPGLPAGERSQLLQRVRAAAR